MEEDKTIKIYEWHPLRKYVIHASSLFKKYNLNDNFYKNIINLYKYSEDEEVQEIVKIFEPLIITCYNNLVLFKYKNLQELFEEGYDDTFWGLHNGLYKECRSVVFDLNNFNIVLAPQHKFFNYNEREESSLEKIKQLINEADEVEFSNKMDGSNQNYRYYNGAIIGSGSQALNPSLSWRLKDGYGLINENYIKMLKTLPDFTFMFEYISQENQNVVQYSEDKKGLYLFGARNVFTGVELSYSIINIIGKHYNVPTVEIYNTSLDNILQKSKEYNGLEKEGWVLSIKKPNQFYRYKFKIKTDDYIKIHTNIKNWTSPNSIIKAIADGTLDDLQSKIPNNFKDICRPIIDIVNIYVSNMNYNIDKYYDKCYNIIANFYEPDEYNKFSDRIKTKIFAITGSDFIPDQYFGYVMNKFNGKENNYLKKGSNGYKKLNELFIDEKENFKDDE